MRLRADVKAPGAARAYVHELIGDSGLPEETCEAVVLMTSELVTNAVQADADEVSIGLRITDDGVLLSVSDDAGGWPEVAPAETRHQATSGHGLAIVEELADDWEVVRLAVGKRVRVLLSPRRTTPEGGGLSGVVQAAG